MFPKNIGLCFGVAFNHYMLWELVWLILLVVLRWYIHYSYIDSPCDNNLWGKETLFTSD